MKTTVKEAIKADAFGISTELKYVSGSFLYVGEVIELSKVAAASKAIYTIYLREEGLGLLEAVQEAIMIGSAADIPIVLTHHKAFGKPCGVSVLKPWSW